MEETARHMLENMASSIRMYANAVSRLLVTYHVHARACMHHGEK